MRVEERRKAPVSSGGDEASLELYGDGRLRWSWEGSSLAVTQSHGCCDSLSVC